MKKTNIIPVINNKGGVAKTITAVTTASILAQKDFKTLLLDLDPLSWIQDKLSNPEELVIPNVE